jgi:hypothetical protein
VPPRSNKASAGRSVGAAVPEVAQNPYAAPEPGPRAPVPVKTYIVPPLAPMPEVRAHGHVLTERGWVREEGNHDG